MNILQQYKQAMRKQEMSDGVALVSRPQIGEEFTFSSHASFKTGDHFSIKHNGHRFVLAVIVADGSLNCWFTAKRIS